MSPHLVRPHHYFYRLFNPSTMLAYFGLGLCVLPFAAAATWNTYQVSVGPNGQLVYDPEYVYAKPGDVVTFAL